MTQNVSIMTKLSPGPNISSSAVANNSMSGAPVVPSLQSTNFVPSQSKGSSVGGTALGATIGVLGNLVGDAINYKRQKDMYSTQRQHALDDYAMQRKDYLDDLASERAYNSPLAQVARLKAAGINPNVAFGSGSPANTSSGAENTSGVRGAVASAPPTGSSLGTSFLQGATGLISSSVDMAQARSLEADLAVKNASVLKMLSESRGVDEKTKAQMIQNGWLDSMYESEVNERFQRISESIDRMNTAAIDRATKLYDLYNLKPAQVQKINAEINSIYQNIAMQVQQYEYFIQVKDYRAAIEKFNSIKADYDSATASLEHWLTAQKVPLVTDTKGDSIAKRIRNELGLWIETLSPFRFKFD